jgi:hypothetical protein
MNKATQRLIACLLFVFALNDVAYSQTLSKESLKIVQAWEYLDKHPNSAKARLAYIKIFPGDQQLFTKIFDPDDYKELYGESYKYIDRFVGLAKFYPKQVIDKSVDIGKDLIWRADATGQLQQSTVELGVSHISIFIKKIKTLPKYKVDHLITFLADVENHKAYAVYQQLIDSLNKTGETRLATKFIRARALREKEKL